MMAYSQRWESSRPGCLIFLLDQSGSMSDSFGAAQAGAGRRKCHMGATVLNGFLDALIVTNNFVQKDRSCALKPRAEVALISYEGNFVGSVLRGILSGRDFVTLPECQMHP